MPTVKAHVTNAAVQTAAAVVSIGMDKLVIAVAVIAAATYLTAVDKLDSAACIGILSAIVGYVFGRSTQNVIDNPPEDK